MSTLARWLGKDPVLEYPVGLEQDNRLLLKPFCPPYYQSMGDAVRAFVQAKFGEDGTYRGGTQQECLARIGFLCRQDNGTERSDGASDRSVLRLCFSTLRKIPSLYGAVSDRYWIPGLPRRHRFL